MKNLHLLSFILFPLFCLSQEIVPSLDTNYIEKMDDKLSVKLNFNNDLESFKFDDGNTGFTINPNLVFKTKLSAHYRFISLSAGFSPAFLNNADEDLKGETKVFKMQMDLFLKKWIQSFEYSKVKGHYLSDYNSNSGALPNGTQYLILPDLKTKSYKGVTRYKFNDDFSVKAFTNQNEIQRKSTGSFIPSLTYNYSEIKAIQDLSSFRLILNAAYFHTFVINKKFYSSLGISPGAGMEYNKIITYTPSGSITDRDNDLIFNLDSYLGLGYNSNNFFGGANLEFLIETRKNNAIIQFDTFRSIFNVFVGYRFDAPKFLKKSTDWIEEENPLK